MSSVYTNSRPMANRVIMAGIVAANGQYVVEDGMEDVFLNLPRVRKGLACGEIKYRGNDNPDSESEVDPGMNLSGAAEIAESEFHVDKRELRALLRSGEVPGYLGDGKYAIPESGLRESLGKVTERRSAEPEPTPEPEG